MKDYIAIIAQREGKSREEVYQAIQEAIDIAWNSKDLASIATRMAIFPEGKRPTPEEFIQTLACKVKQKT